MAENVSDRSLSVFQIPDTDVIIPPIESLKIVDFWGKNQRSVVWQYIGFYAYADNSEVVDRSKAVCKVCKGLLKYNGNTTNLFSHLERNHPDIVHPGLSLSNMTTAKTEKNFEHTVQNRNGKASCKSTNLLSPANVKIKSPVPIGKPFAAVGRPMLARHAMPAKTIPASTITNFTKICAIAQDDSSFSKTVGQIPQASASIRLQSKAIAAYIIKDLQPIHTLAGSGFKDLLKSFDPRYELPQPTYFTEQLFPSMYQSLQSQMLSKVQTAEKVAIIIDLWDSWENSHYLTISAQIVDETFKCSNFVLMTVKLQELGGDSLATTLQEMALEWNIVAPYLITDSTDIAKDAGYSLKWLNIASLGNVIDKAIKCCFEQDAVSDLLQSCRRIARYFHSNAPASESFMCKQHKLLGTPSPAVIPIPDDGAIWQQTFTMLCTISQQYVSLSAAMLESDNDQDQMLLLSSQQIEQLNDLVDLLQPISLVINTLCRQASPCVSLIIPVLHQLDEHLTSQETDSNFVSCVKGSLARNLWSPYYANVSVKNILFVSTSIDPRFKTLPFLTASERGQAKTQLQLQAAELVTPDNDNDLLEMCGDEDNEPKAKKPRSENAVPHGFQNSPCGKGTDDSSGGISMLLGRLMKENRTKSMSSYDKVKNEIQRFSEEPTIPLDCSPLPWWNSRSSCYPILSRLARNLLCIPATGVQAQRIFTQTGHEVLQKRCAVEPMYRDMLIFLNKNTEYTQPELPDST